MTKFLISEDAFGDLKDGFLFAGWGVTRCPQGGLVGGADESGLARPATQLAERVRPGFPSSPTKRWGGRGRTSVS
jgi:hypothetical protein